MKIIMNPPYDKNLHLKILQEAMKHSDDVVNLSPIRWLQDPLAEYKKGSDWKKFGDVRERIESLDRVSSDEAAKFFSARLSFDLGIYHIMPGEYFGADNIRWIKDNINFKSIFEKVEAKKLDNLNTHIEHNKRDGIRYRVQAIKPRADFDPRGGRVYTTDHSHDYDFGNHKRSFIYVDGMQDGKDWTYFGNRNQFTKAEGAPLPESIKFNTEEEAKNFEAYVWTKFFRFCNFMTKLDVHVQLQFLPYLGDYTHPWDDKQLYEYFGLTDDEIKEIEKEIG
jgi:hypothetical protein